MALGLTRRGIQHRIARGRLHPVGRGIYAVGRPELTQHGQWMAAILACGGVALVDAQFVPQVVRELTYDVYPADARPALLGRLEAL